MSIKSKKGISVIVCCYNSSERIGKTLSNLGRQQFYTDIPWEVIIVDNNSTDLTGEVARDIWKQLEEPAKMRVTHEPLPGLASARMKGIAEASFPYVLFCDDDNWLTENYLRGMYDILDGDAMIAACGGMGVPVFETEEPYWFYEYAEAFALGSQAINMEQGVVLNLYGAGLAARKQVLLELYRSGFEQILPDRTGNALRSAGDTELTYAMVLAGYKLACTDDLKFFHYLPKERLTRDYLNRLFIAFGTDGPIRNLYYSFISKRISHRLVKYWSFHFALSLFRIVKYLVLPPKRYGRGIYFRWSVAYIRRLFSLRAGYAGLRKGIAGLKDIHNRVSLHSVASKREFIFHAREHSDL